MLRRFSRGLSLLELMLALAITAMVALAITGMLGAVCTGVGTRSDTRTLLLRGNAAQSRLGSYIAPSRCVLDINGSDLVLWLNDSRQSDTVHATEIRWLLFDAAAGSISVSYVKFPTEWTQAARDLADNEYPADTDWMSVLLTYQASGWIASHALVDGLASASVTSDNTLNMDSRHLCLGLGFQLQDTVANVMVSATIRQHQAPTS